MEGKWKDWHGWSRSRQSLIEQCERKYYYQYVGSYDQDYGDVLPTTKRMLRGMCNFNFLLGNMVHEAIEKQFDQVSRGRIVEPQEALLAATKFVDRRIGEIVGDKGTHIIESMNGKEIPAGELQDISNEAMRQLGIFFNEFYGFYKSLEIVQHEKYCFVEVGEHRVWLKPDLVTASGDGRVYISDWKTDSTYSDAIDEYQMKIYILWALDQEISDLSCLRAETVFLDVGRSEEFKTDEGALESFRNELAGKAKDLYGLIDTKSGKDDFSKCSDAKICVSCGFKPYCDKDE